MYKRVNVPILKESLLRLKQPTFFVVSKYLHFTNCRNCSWIFFSFAIFWAQSQALECNLYWKCVFKVTVHTWETKLVLHALKSALTTEKWWHYSWVMQRNGSKEGKDVSYPPMKHIVVGEELVGKHNKWFVFVYLLLVRGKSSHLLNLSLLNIKWDKNTLYGREGTFYG